MISTEIPRWLRAWLLLFEDAEEGGRPMRLLGWLGGGQANSIPEGEIKQLTDQFYVTLRANFARMKALDGKLAPDALQHLKDLLNPTQPRSWSDAYEIEQMLVYLFDEETLKTELGVRSLEAHRTLSSPLADLYAKEMMGVNSQNGSAVCLQGSSTISSGATRSMR
jgi:hypothetical protein